MKVLTLMIDVSSLHENDIERIKDKLELEVESFGDDDESKPDIINSKVVEVDESTGDIVEKH